MTAESHSEGWRILISQWKRKKKRGPKPESEGRLQSQILMSGNPTPDSWASSPKGATVLKCSQLKLMLETAYREYVGFKQYQILTRPIGSKCNLPLICSVHVSYTDENKPRRHYGWERNIIMKLAPMIICFKEWSTLKWVLVEQ